MHRSTLVFILVLDMSWNIVLHGACASLFLWHCRHELDVLLYFNHVVRDKHIPTTHEGVMRSMHRLKATAWAGLLRTLVMYLLFLGYVHTYKTTHVALEAQKAAAKMQAPPWHCVGNTDWDTLSWGERVYVMMGPPPETACAQYLASIELDTWPNPLNVATDLASGIFIRPFVSIVDGASVALEKLLSHHGAMIQLYLLCLLPLLAIALVFCAPWIQMWWRTHHPSPPIHAPYHPLQIEEIDTDYMHRLDAPYNGKLELDPVLLLDQP